MASLHMALQSLGPIAFGDFPSNPKERCSATCDLLTDARLIVESVPTQQPSPICLTNGENNCDGYNTITFSTQSADAAFPASPQLSALRREWGKPVNKLNNSKDNPLQIPVYKLSGKDGKGAWFARRSVHEGLPFDRWRAKLKGEFEETMRLRTGEVDQIQNLEKEKIRGLGCERRIEEVEVYDDDQDDKANGLENKSCRQIGLFEVYHLSARFPGPASPRDFVALLLSSDVAFHIGRSPAAAAADDDDDDDDVDSNGNNVGKSEERYPRHFMVISKPCHHPDASPRQGYIRGEYESVEFIRELPPAKSNDGLNGKEARPVEWIMITRSDPGGSVPRWMVERGTPPSIVGDAMKFMAWASREDDPDEAEGSGIQLTTRSSDISIRNDSNLNSNEDNGAHEYSDCDESGECTSQTGSVPANATNRISTGLEKAQQAVLDYMPARPSSVASDSSFHSLPQSPRSISVSLCSDSENKQPQSTNTNSPSISIMDTFASADSRASSLKSDKNETAITSVPNQIPVLFVSQPQSINASSSSSTDINIGPPYPRETKEHKKLVKLALRKREVENKLASSRAALDSLRRGSGNRSVESNSSDDHGSIRGTGIEMSNAKEKSKKEDRNDNDNLPTPATLRKRATTLTKDETKLKEQIKKIETEEQKVSLKVEAKRRKEAAGEEKAKAKGEIDGLKSEIRRLKEVVADLRGERETWVELVERLRKENKMLLAEKEGEGKG